MCFKFTDIRQLFISFSIMCYVVRFCVIGEVANKYIRVAVIGSRFHFLLFTYYVFYYLHITYYVLIIYLKNVGTWPANVWETLIYPIFCTYIYKWWLYPIYSYKNVWRIKNCVKVSIKRITILIIGNINMLSWNTLFGIFQLNYFYFFKQYYNPIANISYTSFLCYFLSLSPFPSLIFEKI